MCNVSGLVLNSQAHEPVSCRINGSVGSAGSQLPSILPLTATRSRCLGRRQRMVQRGATPPLPPPEVSGPSGTGCFAQQQAVVELWSQPPPWPGVARSHRLLT